MHTRIIGIDRAVDPRHIGLSLAAHSGSVCRLLTTELESRDADPAELIARWISESERTLLCLDSPLGWPAALGKCLARHTAGEAVGKGPTLLFRRHTDRVVRKALGKQTS